MIRLDRVLGGMSGVAAGGLLGHVCAKAYGPSYGLVLLWLVVFLIAVSAYLTFFEVGRGK